MESAHLTSKYREESDRVTLCHHTYLLLRRNFWQLLFEVEQTSKDLKQGGKNLKWCSTLTI